MKYFFQFGIILIITFIGEILYALLPLPIPGSIYGLLIMFVCLCTKVIKLHQVEAAGDFLLEIMPMMFIPGSVGLLESWDALKNMWLPLMVISVVTTVLVMAVTGWVTQGVMKKGGSNHGTVD